MKTHGMDKFSQRLDEIFEQGMPTKAQILDAYNKAVELPSLTKERIIEVLKNNYAKCCLSDYVIQSIASALCSEPESVEPDKTELCPNCGESDYNDFNVFKRCNSCDYKF